MSETDALISKLHKLRKKKIKEVTVIEKENLYKDGEKVDGLAFFDINEIHLEKKLGQFGRLETEIHELMHLLYPKAKEKEIAKNSEIMARFLWQLNYRQTKQPESKVKIKFK